MTHFPADSIRKYFENRLPGVSFRGTQCMVQCPFHDDGSASLSLNLDRGIWFCHTGCGNGGIVDFEKKFSECDDGTAWVAIQEIMGIAVSGSRPQAVYVYEDEFARPLFRVVRYPRDEEGKKSFQQQSYNGKGWDKGNTARRVLYHLPEVIVSNEVFVVEGEKDADNLRGLKLFSHDSDAKVTATTNPGGAGKWQDDYSPFLTGKRVFILPDNDDTGRKHAEQVAHSISRYAAGVKIIALPGLPEKGDVSDYLANHAAEELIAEVRKAKRFHVASEVTEQDGFFVPAMRLAVTVPDEIDWMISGVIPAGWNGFVVADPKSLKSYSVLDMMIHLSLGKNWMGFTIPRAFRTAMLAREDYWGLTAWRIKHFARGMVRDEKITSQEIDYLSTDGLFVNTQAQEATWYLDNDADVTDLIRRLKDRKVEFLAMDVFRVLFMGDESDNTEMQQVLDRVKRIRAEVGCGIGIVHHARKDGLGDIFQRARGASAIHGFMEWGIGITTENPDDERSAWIRKMEFLTKAGNSPAPIHIRAEGGEQEGFIRLARTEYTKPKRRTKPADIVASANLPYAED